MANATDRQRTRRARLRERGYQDITVTIRCDQVGRLKSLAEACNEGRPVSLRLIPCLNVLRADATRLRQSGVARAGVFGSAARGDDGPDSDVDIVLVLEPGAELDLLAVTALKDRVAQVVGSELAGVPVDVSIRDHMREEVRAAVDHEAVYAY